MKPISLLSLFALTASAIGAQVSYNGYKVFRVPAATEGAAADLRKVIDSLDLETWKAPMKAGAFADIMVSPEKLGEFERLVGNRSPIVMHDDLAASIANEGSFEAYQAGTANISWFNSYHSYQEHQQFLESLQSTYPSNSELVSSGQSAQGNNITGIHFYGRDGKGKPAIVFHGTVHAREWITTMVTEYLVYNLLSNYESDGEIKGFLDKYDFYVFPIVNPDGFIYTQTNERMWRKNRQSAPGSSCVGTDVNRNWAYMWNGKGSSTNPCSETYRGPAEASSPEAKALAQWLNNVKRSQGLKLYIDWHSYSQLFMSPYGFTCNQVPAKNGEFQSLMRGAVNAIKSVHGTSFDYGPICSTIYQVAGSSVDYVNDVTKADYTFTVELRDTGRYGFVLPPSQILPSGEETYAGVRYLLQNMK